jgi:hypothetical protein
MLNISLYRLYIIFCYLKMTLHQSVWVQPVSMTTHTQILEVRTNEIKTQIFIV